MSDRITFSIPYCFLDINTQMVTFTFQTSSNFDVSGIPSPCLTSVSVRVPHLAAQDHLHTEIKLNIVSLQRKQDNLWRSKNEINVFGAPRFSFFVCSKALSEDKKWQQGIILTHSCSLALLCHQHCLYAPYCQESKWGSCCCTVKTTRKDKKTARVCSIPLMVLMLLYTLGFDLIQTRDLLESDLRKKVPFPQHLL